MVVGDTKSISEIVSYFAHDFPGERITLGDFVDVLGERSFGILLLIFALPSVLPLGAIPGVSAVFGLPMAVVALQLMLGLKKPVMPSWLLSRSIPRADLARIVTKVMPYLQKTEKLLKPRLPLMTGSVAERIVGGICLALAAIVTLPIPFGNQPPSTAVALFALGLFERDGLFVIAGFIASIFALILLFTVYFAAFEALLLLLRQF